MPVSASIKSVPSAIMLVLVLSNRLYADFTPIPLTSTSFNYDIVVENTAPAPLVGGAYTTASMDSGIGNSGTSWYEQGYNTASPTTGLPPAGTTFTHQNASDHQYAMAPSYTANNSVMVDSTFTSARLTFVSPTSYSRLSFLESGGHNGVAFNYLVHHQDGSSESGSGSIPDWYNGASPAWTANGRIDVGIFAFSSVNGNNPRAHSLDISFATVAGFSPIAVTVYNADIVVEASAPKSAVLSGVPTATMEAGTNNSANTWYELAYVTSSPATGLPHPGSTFTNISAPDRRYVMPTSYTANNAILISSNT